MQSINKHWRVLVGVGAMLCLCAAVDAEPSSKQRVQAFAKLPDWTGMWEPQELNSGASGKAKPGTTPFQVTSPMVTTPVSYRPEWLQKAATVIRGKQASGPRCIFGFPSVMASQLMFQVFIAPEETALIFSGREVRHVYTDGRAHPKPEDLWETPWGDSIGHWEGETLVIDTVAAESLEGGGVTGSRFSNKAHFVERIRMIDKNRLENKMIVDDPEALAQPWELTINYKRVTDIDRMVDEDCIGNERNFMADGKQGVVVK
ncbi:MAG: hypothetical protein QM808_06990 [Steroidobacteraceae bacterium]